MNPLADALVSPLENRDAPTLILPSGETVSGRALHEMSGRMSNTLRNLGVQPGDRVAVQAEKSPAALALYLACLRLGAIFLPLNTAYTNAEMGFFIDDAEPRVVVCDPVAERELGALSKAGPTTTLTLDASGGGALAELAGSAGSAFATVGRSANDTAVILYTSGTTGKPKGAMLTHNNLLSNAEALAGAWRFTADDVLLHALPIFHAHGLFVAVNIMLRVCGAMIFLPKFDLDTVVAHLPASTAMMGVPTFYTRFLDDRRFDRDLVSHLRVFISGSAPLLAETHRAFEMRTGHRILERYGMTETSMNTSNPYDGERRAGTVGLPLPGIEVRVADPETGAFLAQGETGVLEVRGPNVFKGYWRMPEKTGEDFRPDGFFITGDLAKIDADGYVTIIGRAKDLVISGGFNVYPKEVEAEIDALDGIVESAVIGVPHPDFGEAVVAVVVRSSGSELTRDEIITALGQRLAKYKRPKAVAFVDELPRNTMGKVQKNLLRESHKGTFN